MKTISGLLILIPLFVISLSGCKKTEQSEIQILSFKHSECKSEFEGANHLIENLQNRISLKSQKSLSESLRVYFSENNALVVEHNNTYFNCCPGKIVTGVKSLPNKIIITEDETKPSCNCICPYDLELKISGMIEGFIELGIEKQGLNYISFYFNLTFQTDTTFIIRE